jgi:curli biogenesis system outer membrane secretion channel CsgG
MTVKRKNLSFAFLFSAAFLFLLTSCADLPLIGKKKEKADKFPEGRTVTVEGMETIKGTNPSKPEAPPSKKPTVPPASKKEPESRVASAPTRPFYTSPLPFFQAGFKRKVMILDFDNKTTYQDEKIGEIASKRLSEKLDATQRVIPLDRTSLVEMFNREGLKFESPTESSVMKRAYRSLGIQAFVSGTVTDVSILSSKASEGSEEEIAFATAKVEIRLIDASTGNLLKSFIGRSPIFGTKEAGEYSKSKAVLKAIDFSLDEILEGFIRQLDLLDWTTTIAKIEGDHLYINSGKLSGLRIGDTLEIFEHGKEIIHPASQFSLGWTTGPLKGLIKVNELFGVDAAIGKVVQGNGFDTNDVVKSATR